MMLTAARSASVVVMAVKCAWCSAEIVKGTPGAPVSHGICQSCADSQLSALRFVLKGAA